MKIGDNAGSRNRTKVEPHVLQTGRQQFGRAVFLASQFGIGMEITTYGHHFITGTLDRIVERFPEGLERVV